MAPTVHIIGAGISGLAAGVRLADAGRTVHVHEATQQVGGRCRSYYDGATDLVIDNGNHLLLSGNHHALAYARLIGNAAGLTGPADARFDFVDFATDERWLLRINDGRVPFWVFDPKRRVPATRPADYFALAPLVWAGMEKTIGEAIRCEGPLYQRLVHPLMLAALNIDPPRGSAGLAGAILRETLLVGGGDFFLGRLDGEVALVELDHRLDEGDLHLEARTRVGGGVDDPDRLAEADDDRLAPLIDDEEGLRQDDQHHGGDDAQDGVVAAHRAAPVVGASAAGAAAVGAASPAGRGVLRGRKTSGGRMIGALAPLPSMITLFEFWSTRCMVSI